VRDQLRYWLELTGLAAPIRAARAGVRRGVKIPGRRRKIATYLASHGEARLHIGSGVIVLPGWLNVDLDPPTPEVVLMNATRRFPLPSGRFTHVFSEHMIEHVSWEAGQAMLGECFRVMRPGGRIRIATPDLRFLIALYDAERSELQQRYVEHTSRADGTDAHEPFDVFTINRFFKAWGHQFIYDCRALRLALETAGFTCVVRRPVGESDDPVLRGIEHHGDSISREFNLLETVVVEAVKGEA
jgi:predicted SAM-dependent methyltransferase